MLFCFHIDLCLPSFLLHLLPLVASSDRLLPLSNGGISFCVGVECSMERLRRNGWCGEDKKMEREDRKKVERKVPGTKREVVVDDESN